MPAPTNISAATATDIGTLPTGTISQTVDFAGTTYTVWYKYTAVTGDFVIGIKAVGDLTVYTPDIQVYSPDGVTSYLSIVATNVPIQFPVIVGDTYFFKIIPNFGNPTPANLTIQGEQAPNLTMPIGTVFVPADVIETGFPGVGMAAATGARLRFVTFPNSEIATILNNGKILIAKSPNTYVYSPQLAVLATNAGYIAAYASSDHVSTFYVSKVVAGVINVRTMDEAAVFGPTTWLLPATASQVFAPSPDNLILYFKKFAGGVAPVGRWDLIGNVAMADLVAGTANEGIGNDIIVLSDGTVIVPYTNSATNVVTIKAYSPAGATLHTYSFSTDVHQNHLAVAVDDPNSFWAWFLVPTFGGDNSKFSRYVNIKVSDGSLLNDFTVPQFVNGAYNPAPNATPTRFGPSNSCPFLILREAIGPPAPPTPPVTRVYPMRRQRTFTIPNAENFWIFIKRIEFELQRGMGLSTGQGSDPTLMFQLSRDGGKTWGPEQWMSAGRQGEYTHRSIVRRLGRARNPVGRITTSDPTFWALCDAYLQAGPGTS